MPGLAVPDGWPQTRLGISGLSMRQACGDSNTSREDYLLRVGHVRGDPCFVAGLARCNEFVESG